MSADETVRCDFQAGGINQVKEGFRTVEQSLLRLEKLSVASSARETKGRIDSAIKTAKAREDAEQALLKAVMQGERDRLAATIRAEKERIRATEMSVSERRRAMRGLAEESARMERHVTDAVKGELRARTAAEHAAQARRAQMGSAITGGLARGVARPIGGMMQYGGMALSMGGGFAVADAAKGYMSTQASATALANSMFNPNDEGQAAWLKKNGVNGRFDKKALMAFAGEASAVSGVDKTSFLAGAQDYIAKSSDWEAMATKKGQSTMVGLAKMAVATGTDFGQLMSAAGSLRVQNPDLEPEKMMDMMRAIVGQGKMGAVEMKDLATHSAVITSGAGKYVGKGGYKDQAEAQQALLGLSQIAIRTSGSAAEAATAVKSFGSDLGAKGSKAEHGFAGLKIKDKDGSLLKASDIVENVFTATKGDTTKMGEGKGHVGMGRESIRIMEALKTQFDIGKQEALAKNPKLSEAEAIKAGAKRAGDEVRKFERAGYKQSGIDRDHSEVMADAGKKIEMASGRIRDALEVKMAPVVERLADKFVQNEKGLTKFVDAIGKAAEFLLENPYKGVALIISASVAKEMAAAGIGAAFKAAMEKALTRGGGGGGGGPGGVVAPAVALGVGSAMVVSKAMLGYEAGNDRAEDIRAKLSAYQRGDHERGMSPEAARAELEAARTRLSKTNALEQAANLATSPFVESSDRDYKQFKADQGLVDNKELAASLEAFKAGLKESTAALREHSSSAAAADPNNPRRNLPGSDEARGGTYR